MEITDEPKSLSKSFGLSRSKSTFVPPGKSSSNERPDSLTAGTPGSNDTLLHRLAELSSIVARHTKEIQALYHIIDDFEDDDIEEMQDSDEDYEQPPKFLKQEKVPFFQKQSYFK